MIKKTSEQIFEQVISDIRACRACEVDFGFEPHPVVIGNKNAKIVQISQAPSKTVHQTMLPFDDQSGVKLKYEWYGIDDATFYDPDNFYIGAMAHCFPGKNKSGGDRLPPKRCAKLWMEKELAVVENELYIFIGRIAANYFFPKRDFAELIFSDNELNGKKAIVLPHPSPLNIKWFKDHPLFLENRLLEIRKEVQLTLGR